MKQEKIWDLTPCSTRSVRCRKTSKGIQLLGNLAKPERDSFNFEQCSTHNRHWLVSFIIWLSWSAMKKIIWLVLLAIWILQSGPLRTTGVRINFSKNSLYKINSFSSNKNLTLAEFFGGDKNVLVWQKESSTRATLWIWNKLQYFMIVN